MVGTSYFEAIEHNNWDDLHNIKEPIFQLEIREDITT